MPKLTRHAAMDKIAEMEKRYSKIDDEVSVLVDEQSELGDAIERMRNKYDLKED